MVGWRWMESRPLIAKIVQGPQDVVFPSAPWVAKCDTLILVRRCRRKNGRKPTCFVLGLKLMIEGPRPLRPWKLKPCAFKGSCWPFLQGTYLDNFVIYTMCAAFSSWKKGDNAKFCWATTTATPTSWRDELGRVCVHLTHSLEKFGLIQTWRYLR